MCLPRAVASTPGHVPCSSCQARALGQGESRPMGQRQRKRGDQRGWEGKRSHLAYWVPTLSPSAAPPCLFWRCSRTQALEPDFLGLNPGSAASCAILENQLPSITLFPHPQDGNKSPSLLRIGVVQSK